MSTADTENRPPTMAETNAAIDRIGESKPAHAAEALKYLIREVMAAVQKVDRIYNLSAYLTKLEISALGEGDFQVAIEDKESVDLTEFLADLSQQEDMLRDYGKAARLIDLTEPSSCSPQ